MQCLPPISDDQDSLPVALGILNVSHNNVRALPEGLEHCQRLQQIYAAANEMEDLPASLCCLPVVDLFVSENPFRKFPAVIPSITSLVKLSISCCEVDELPENINRLSCLR